MIWPTDYLNRVICGDCLEVMRGIPDKSVDAVITDPPYGIGFAYDSHDDNIENYWPWFRRCLAEMRRVGNNVVFTHRQSALKEITDYDWLGVWEKPMSFAHRVGKWLPHWEPIFIYGKPKEFTTDVFSFNTAKANGHPCPKPLDLVKRIVSLWDGIILDPFCGSGTTAAAAKLLGRQFIGIEISEKYCEIARKRIDGTLVNRKLNFAEARP